MGKTRKGRGYHVFDNKSHGSPHKMNSELFWKCRQDFADIYDVAWVGQGEDAPKGEALRKQFGENLNVALDVLRNDEATCAYLADRLVELGDSVPQDLPGFRIPVDKNPLKDEAFFDYENYPESMWAKPGEKKPNRAALARWGSWVNSAAASSSTVRCFWPARPTWPVRPTSKLRQRLRRHAQLRLVRAESAPRA